MARYGSPDRRRRTAAWCERESQADVGDIELRACQATCWISAALQGVDRPHQSASQSPPSSLVPGRLFEPLAAMCRPHPRSRPVNAPLANNGTPRRDIAVRTSRDPDGREDLPPPTPHDTETCRRSVAPKPTLSPRCKVRLHPPPHWHPSPRHMQHDHQPPEPPKLPTRQWIPNDQPNVHAPRRRCQPSCIRRAGQAVTTWSPSLDFTIP